MRTHARAVVIGGGIVGCSVLYHLAKLGWSDSVLLEKADLTHGSTWHAAGLLPLFNMSYAVGQLHKVSIDLYQRLEAETGQAVSFHQTGNLRLATSHERMDEYRKYCGTANTIGVPFEMIGPTEIAAKWPLCETGGLVGALFHPDDGHVAPADVTQALAIGARAGGAEINRNTEVVAIARARNGEWTVKTAAGDVTAEVVVTATGAWAREVGAMVGLDVPMIPVEHQYLVTEEVPELEERKAAGLAELPVLRESDASYYIREEREGLILGPYEAGARAWAVEGVPKHFGQELLAPDIDRLQPYIEAAIARVPMLGRAGIKECINGPIPYTPDGNPLIGPAYGLSNFYLCEGFSFGITSAGGAGKVLAEWIVEGEPSIDLLAVDARRFGAYANACYTELKNVEAYENVFTIHYPDEERPAARPAKTSPCHERLAAHGAVWGQRYGWERPNWFAPEGIEARDECSFRRTNYFGPVGDECRAVRERAGLIDITSFAKFEVSGAGAHAALDGLLANALPGAVGRMRLAHALTQRGGVRSEFTITRLGPDRFYLVSSGAAERYDHDLLLKRLLAPDVRVENLTSAYGVLVVTGPRAREVLAPLTAADLSNAAFPWLTAREITLGLAGVRALRVNFVGELGWELHHPHRSPEPSLRLPDGGGRGLRHGARRDAGDGCAQDREVLPHVGPRPDPRVHGVGGRARALRQPRQGPLRRPRGADRAAPQRRAATLRHPRGRGRGCRCARQRAHLAGRAHGRARDLGRLRPHARQVAGASLPRSGPCGAGNGARDRDPRCPPRRHRHPRFPPRPQKQAPPRLKQSPCAVSRGDALLGAP